VTESYSVDKPDLTLKVATRVRIPLRLQKKDQFRGHKA
jgi:hypothetical protein